MLVTSVCCGLIPFFAGMAFYFKTVAGERHKTALPIGLVASVVPPLLVAMYGIVSLSAAYNGVCEGPPDYSAPCTYGEYLEFHLFNGIEVFGYLVLCAFALGWMGLVFAALGYFFRRDRENTYR